MSASATFELPPNADVLALDQILQSAYEKSPDVQVAQSRIQLGDAAIDGEPLIQWNPEVWVGLGVRTNVNGGNFELQAQLDQRIEVFGERRMRIRAARAYKRQLERELDKVKWSIYARVHAAYNSALLAKQRAETAAGVVAFSQRLVDTAKRRAAAGEISNLRVRIAEGEFAQARQHKLAADLDFKVAANQLSESAGWPKERLLVPSGDLRLPEKVGDPDSFYEKAMTEHPMIAAQQAAVATAEARLDSANRDRFPEPMVGAYVSRENEPGGIGVPTTVGLATVTIPIPLWQRNQKARARAKAELEVARAELGAVEYRLGLQIRRAVDAVNTAAERVETYSRDVVPRFEENMEMLEQAFELGEVDIIEVFVARSRFLSIQNQALDAYGSYYQAIRDFESLVGASYPDAVAANPTR
ncbi:MAG: TolC family protein [Nannocystaceae bacterium]